jgi:hypothetical protein
VAEFAEVCRRKAYQGSRRAAILLAAFTTIADITALVAMDFTSFPAEVKFDLHHLKRWHDEVSRRSSAKA